MSGVDSTTSSTSTVPPTGSEPALPPPLPSGIETEHEHDHDAEDLVGGVGVHLVTEGTAMVYEEVGVVNLTGEAIGVISGAGAGAILSGIGWGIALAEMGHAILTAPREGTREGLVEAALGGRGWETSRAFGAGIASVMLDLTDAEVSTAARGFPAGPLRDQFLDGVANARASRDEREPGWAEAREEYREIFRAYSDGCAAAIGGWDTPGRGEVFAGAREAMSTYLEAHPTEAAAMRTEYQAHVRDGFLAADGDHVDAHRYELDAGYRCGVEHRRSLEGADLERERHDIVGMSASSFTLGSFAA